VLPLFEPEDFVPSKPSASLQNKQPKKMDAMFALQLLPPTFSVKRIPLQGPIAVVTNTHINIPLNLTPHN
jgi:hypothetical protein